MGGGNAEIDITLVAACRPDLLAATLESFTARVFPHFGIRRFIANIDPILGTDAEGDDCEQLIKGYFPRAEITRPASPGFGQAVKTVWGRTGEPPVFHMEDDWRALADVTPDMILPRLAPDVGMVTLAQRRREPGEEDTIMRTRKVKVLGVTLGKRTVNGYGTSPRFIAAGLAARYADLLIPWLDPEKQVLEERNPALSALQQQFKCMKVWDSESGPLIADLGRDWLRARNVRKVYRKSRVTWLDP